MGAPIELAKTSQVTVGASHIKTFIRELKAFEFDRPLSDHAPERSDPLRAGRGVRTDHPVELADEPGDPQGRARPRGRLHRGAQAVRGGAALLGAVRRDDRRSRIPGRRVQPGQRGRCRRRDPALGPSRHRHGVVHRLDPSRRGDHQERRRFGEAGRPGAGRQRSQHHLRRRRRQSGHPRRAPLLQQLRTVLQRTDSDARRTPDVRRRRRNREEGGRTDRRRHRRPRGSPHRTGRLAGAVRQDPGTHRQGRGGRRPVGRGRHRKARRPRPRLLRATHRLRRRQPPR